MSGSATYKRNESKNQNAPWIGQQPFLTDVFSQAQGLYNQGTPGYLPRPDVHAIQRYSAAGDGADA